MKSIHFHQRVVLDENQPFVNSSYQKRSCVLYFETHEAVVVAVDVEEASAVELEASFGVAFGVELDKLHPVRCEEGRERNKMGFCHRVVDGNEMLVLHFFDGNTVICIGLFCLQGWQDNAATANEGISHSSENVAADGANIEFRPQNIGRKIPIGNRLSRQQLRHRNTQRLGRTENFV